jgi:hypothetical protein
MVDPKVFSAVGVDASAVRYWKKIWEPITSDASDPNLGTFGPSIAKLSEEAASEIAQRIISLHAMLGSALGH